MFCILPSGIYVNEHEGKGISTPSLSSSVQYYIKCFLKGVTKTLGHIYVLVKKSNKTQSLFILDDAPENFNYDSDLDDEN